MSEQVQGFLALTVIAWVIGYGLYAYRRPAPVAGGPYKTPWNAKESILVTVAIYVASQLVAGLMLVFYLAMVRGVDVTSGLATTSYQQFVYVLIFEALTIYLLWRFMKKRGAGWKTIGLVRPKIGRDVGYAIGGYAVYILSFLAIFAVVHQLFPQIDLQQRQQLGFDTNVTGAALLAVFVSLVILPPIVEEILCRGFLYSGLRSKLKKLPAVIITSLLFAAAHLQGGSGNSLLWVAAIDTFILSVVLIELRDRTKSLAAPILLHMAKNGIAFYLLFIRGL
jgi:membrane protease YdiL (CAAX protease family)